MSAIRFKKEASKLNRITQVMTLLSIGLYSRSMRWLSMFSLCRQPFQRGDDKAVKNQAAKSEAKTMTRFSTIDGCPNEPLFTS
jgi:hypothetical protein